MFRWSIPIHGYQLIAYRLIPRAVRFHLEFPGRRLQHDLASKLTITVISEFELGTCRSTENKENQKSYLWTGFEGGVSTLNEPLLCASPLKIKTPRFQKKDLFKSLIEYRFGRVIRLKLLGVKHDRSICIDYSYLLEVKHDRWSRWSLHHS